MLQMGHDTNLLLEIFLFTPGDLLAGDFCDLILDAEVIKTLKALLPFGLLPFSMTMNDGLIACPSMQR